MEVAVVLPGEKTGLHVVSVSHGVANGEGDG